MDALLKQLVDTGIANLFDPAPVSFTRAN